MNWAVYLAITFAFTFGTLATRADEDVKRFIQPVAGKCSSNEQANCDNSEQLCMNTGTDTNKRIACCLQWKACMNSIRCDTSVFRCD